MPSRGRFQCFASQQPQTFVLVALLVAAAMLAGCAGDPTALNLRPVLQTEPAVPASPSPSPNAASPTSTSLPAPSPPTPAANPTPTPATAPAPPPSPAVNPAPPPSGPLPVPPADATILAHLETQTVGWIICSICAEGTNDTTNLWMAPYQTSPSLSGGSIEFYVGGPQWSNALFVKTFPGHESVSHILWDFWVYWDEASAAHQWTAEFDMWQVTLGREFMIGSQCDFGDGYWDTWDQLHDRWITNPDLPCPRMEPLKWHHIQWYVERISDTQYRYHTLVVDGAVHQFDQVYNATPSNWIPGVGVQWQLDQDVSGHDLHEWVDKITLTLW